MVGAWFQVTFQVAYDNVMGVFRGIGQWFSDRWTDIKDALAAVGAWFQATFQVAYDNIMDIFRGIGQWFSGRWADITGVFSGVGEWFKQIFQKAYDSVTGIFQGIGSWFQENVIDKIRGVFHKFSLADEGQRIADSFTGAIKSTDIPKLSVSWDSAEQTVGDTTIKVPVPSISWNAAGGIMKSPTIFGALGGKLQGGGEAGDEAILPLDIFYKRTEGYIDDAIARATAAVQGRNGSGGHGDFIRNLNITSPTPLSPHEVARQTRNATRNMVLQLQRGRG